MSDPAESQPPDEARGERADPNVSIAQISRFTGLTRETVSLRLDRAGAEPAAKRGGWPVYDMTTVWSVLVHGANGESVRDPDKLEPHARRAHYQAEKYKLDLAAQAAQLIPAAEVEAANARVMKLMAQMTDTLLDVLERDCGATPQMVEVAQKHFDKTREFFADLVEDG